MKLREYQVKGKDAILRFFHDRHCAYLADEMGLGKTAQAIHVALNLYEGCEFPAVLIVCPASLRLNWEKEIKLWTNGSVTSNVIQSKKDVTKIRTGRVIIISYDLAHKAEFLEQLRKRHFDMLICDEAHYLKTRQSRRTTACLSFLWEQATYRLCLSGTPFPNSIMDGYPVFHKMAPEAFPDYYKYGFKYTKPERNWYTGHWEFKGGKNLPELKKILRRSFLIRRTKRDVLTELPPKIYSHIPLAVKGVGTKFELSEAERLAITEAIISGEKALSVAESHVTERRALGLLKCASVVEHVRMLAEERNKIVLFAYHREVIEALAKALESCGVVVVYGKTPEVRRAQYIESFQSDPRIRIFIGQIAAAGVGITLTAASLCVFAELSWIPAEMSQAIDRLHRIGQKSVVEVQYLLASKTMDEAVIHALHDKIQSISEVLRK